MAMAKASGKYTASLAEVTAKFVHHYEALLGNTTLFDIRNDKELRPDGYGVRFVKAAWDTMSSHL